MNNWKKASGAYKRCVCVWCSVCVMCILRNMYLLNSGDSGLSWAYSLPLPEMDINSCRETAYKTVSKVYIRYVGVLRNLDACYDQMLHPQKRILVRKVLEATIGRIIELKHELVNLDLNEFSMLDDILSDMKMTPDKLEIPIPTYLSQERIEEVNYWSGLLLEVRKKMDSHSQAKNAKTMDRVEAIRLLQVHERARQGRLRAKLMHDIRIQQEEDRKNKPNSLLTMTEIKAACRIQRIWRGFLARKFVKQKREEELTFIGMIPPPVYPVVFQEKLKEISASRREKQMEHEASYKKSLLDIKEEIRDAEGPDLTEKMKDDIRKWFWEEKDEQGRFPDYPSDDEGGSNAVFHPENVYQSSEMDFGKRKEERGKKEEKGRKEEIEEEELGFRLQPSQFFTNIKAADAEFKDTWAGRDEKHNNKQEADSLILSNLKRKEVEDETRRVVDAIMREELEILKAAVERDKGKKGKLSKKRKKGKKGQKKGKKKKDKDLTPDRTTESLFEELVMNGIIKQYPKVHLNQFLGEISYSGGDFRKAGKEPIPGPADIRRTISEYCILPLVTAELRENTPSVKSVLLAGAEGCGKSMLVQAVCTELNATLFDLTATNIVGKYPGKSGLNMLVHLVSKVGRLLQPSVIFIDQAEKTFLKKVSKTDKSDPKRLKKDLPKLVKSIGLEDQVILIGCSRCPWECDQKGLTQTYQKMLYLPKPDYSYRYNLWKELILRSDGDILHSQFDLSTLAKISDGWTSGAISRSVTETLTEKRVLQQKFKELQAVEFIAALAKSEPVYREEEDAFVSWYSKTPMGKKKSKLLEGDEEEKEKGREKGKKK
ncbi:IQ and AAA domain-containing protein 1 isoform X2 [Eurytemora carolleeae]|uniref:IQ and AAA domain-containing protein 1 isoform X2 n=1 Tax=Eurytemora carolleeae TaxID=1294199 RepID=UPI000C7886FF|nr:IQ and AAA domain-containing protein 1 isoform X2 [Eurytemora carolleeae]|eukprot:XP_023330690.1 IQ and AAA domain-containing protein 1-like isoform X2 [Eurytemora affinis]